MPEAEVNRQSEFLTAESERLLAHFDKALPLYEKFLLDNPDNDAAWYGIARTHTALKDLAKALDAIQRAIKLDPQNVWYGIYFADLLEQTGRVKDAAAVYENLTKRNPNTPEFFQKLAHLQVLSGDPKSALKSLEKVEKLEGISEETSRSKHLICVGLGDMKRAASELEKLAAEFPDEVVFEYELANFYEKTGDAAAAQRVFERILKKMPDDPVAKIAVAGGKQKGGSDQQILEKLRPLVRDPKLDIDAKIKEILPFFDKIESGKNPDLLNSLLSLATDLEAAHPTEAKAWSISGDLFYTADRLPEALQKYERCLSLNPTVFSVWANTMDILAEQKNFAELRKTAERAMDAFPNQPLAYLNFGYAANQLGDGAAALRPLQQGILMTNNTGIQRLDFESQIGWSLILQKKFEDAKVRLEKVLTKGGERHAGVLEHLGDAYSGLGEREKALEFWRKAKLIQPSFELDKKLTN